MGHRKTMAMLDNQMVINMNVPIKGTRKVIEAWNPVPAVKEDTAQQYNWIQKPDSPMLYYNILQFA